MPPIEPKLELVDVDYRSTFFRTSINGANLRVSTAPGGMHGLHQVDLWCQAQGWKEVATFSVDPKVDVKAQHTAHAVRAAKILKLK